MTDMARVYEDVDGDRWMESPDGMFRCTTMAGVTPLSLSELGETFAPLTLISGEADMVNSPPHYIGEGGIEVIDFIDAFNLGHYEATIVAYVTRWKNKNGLEDLRKAQFYLDRLIKREEKRAVPGH